MASGSVPRAHDRDGESANKSYELEYSSEITPRARGTSTYAQTRESRGILNTMFGVLNSFRPSGSQGPDRGDVEYDELRNSKLDDKVDVDSAPPMTNIRQTSWRPRDHGRHVTADHSQPVSQVSCSSLTNLPGLFSGALSIPWLSNKKRDSTSKGDIQCGDRSPLQPPKRQPQHDHQTTARRRPANTDLFECVDRIENDVTMFQNDANADSLKQALSKFDELQVRYTSSMRRISKLERKLKKATEVNESLMARLEQTNGVVESGPKSVSDQAQRQTLITNVHEQQATENFVFELSEKDEEIRAIKEKCDTRYQRIKILEQEKVSLGEQAKQFEIDYRVELEENRSLKSEIEELKVHLEQLSSISESDNSENDIGEESTTDFKKSLFMLKGQVKLLNEDLRKLRDHSKDQSKQILTLRQQIEITYMMEDQLKSMTEVQHKNEECVRLHEELKKVREEKTALEKQISSIVLEHQKEIGKLREDYTTAVEERDQVMKTLQSMGVLSSQLSESERMNRTLEQKLNDAMIMNSELKNELETANAQVVSYKSDFKAERRDCETARSQIAQLKTKGALVKGEHTSLSADSQHAIEIKILKSQLDEHQQALTAVEQVNRKFDLEVQRARKECEDLQQENRARSSQVKQYAKEVHRLKEELEMARVSTIPEGTGNCQQVDSLVQDQHTSDGGITKLNELYKIAQDDNERLSDENFDLYNQVEELKRINAQLRESPSSSTMLNTVKGMTPDSERECENFSIVNSENHSQLTTLQHQPPTLTFAPIEDSSNSVMIPGKFTNQVHQQETKFDSFSMAPSSYYESAPSTPIQSTLEQSSFKPNTVEYHDQLSTESPSTAPLSMVSESKQPDSEARVQQNTALFENPLQRELDDEIHQQAAQVIQEVSVSRRDANTDLKRPVDPNLVCPMCRKQFRIGEIQRFRRHVNTCTGTND